MILVVLADCGDYLEVFIDNFAFGWVLNHMIALVVLCFMLGRIRSVRYFCLQGRKCPHLPRAQALNCYNSLTKVVIAGVSVG